MRWRKGKTNAGIALPMALGIMAVISILAIGAVLLVSNQTSLGVHYRDDERAFHNADAGINDYIWQMNQNPYFYLDTRNITAKDGTYQVKYVKTASDPNQPGKNLITIQSTGFYNKSQARIEVQLRLRSFAEYVMFTNFEGTQEHSTTKDDLKRDPYHDGIKGNWIMWKTGETITGPIHTNDTFHFASTSGHVGTGPTVNGRITYSNPNVPPTQYCMTHDQYEDFKNGGYDTGDVRVTFTKGLPSWVPKIDWPESNDSLKTLAQQDGLYLKGRTCIYIDHDQIWYTNKSGSRIPVKISAIHNGVVYVDQDGAGGTGKWDLKRGNVFISGTLSGRLTVAAANDIFITGKDPTNYNDPGHNNHIPDKGGLFYADPNGKDMLGLVANGNIQILHTGWPTATGTGGQHDIVGNKYQKQSVSDRWFVAPKNIYINAVLFAVKGSFGLDNYDSNEPKIPKNTDPATFQEDFNQRLDNIYLNGSVIENKIWYVGHADYPIGGKKKEKIWIVNTDGYWHYYTPTRTYKLNTGYRKVYTFDTRLLNASPPHIMDPEQGGWVVVSWKKMAPN